MSLSKTATEIDSNERMNDSTYSSEIVLFLQSFVVKAIYNLDSSRCRNTSLEKRTEGWTEQWGDKSQKDTDDENEILQKYPQIIGKHNNNAPVILHQYHPAWFEQLILRMAGIPHVVINSAYPASEATGKLPYLIHGGSLVGHCHPMMIQERMDDHRNDILRYVQSLPPEKVPNEWNLKALASSEFVDSSQYLIQTLILRQLQPAEELLRFSDQKVWDQVYRPRYFAQRNHQTSIFSAIAAWSDRVTSLRRHDLKQTKAQAKSTIRSCYNTLESHLEKTANCLLFETTKPTITDALLWAHLSHALANIDLISMLTDYPNLIKFYQFIYDQYFVVVNSEKEEWRMWNAHQNNVNNFGYYSNFIYLHSNNKHPSKDEIWRFLMSNYKQEENFSELVASMAQQKQQQQVTKSKQKKTFYIWRMGGEIPTVIDDKKKDASEEKEEASRQEKWREEHKTNDEVWITAVIGVSLLALIFGTQQGK